MGAEYARGQGFRAASAAVGPAEKSNALDFARGTRVLHYLHDRVIERRWKVLLDVLRVHVNAVGPVHSLSLMPVLLDSGIRGRRSPRPMLVSYLPCDNLPLYLTVSLAIEAYLV